MCWSQICQKCLRFLSRVLHSINVIRKLFQFIISFRAIDYWQVSSCQVCLSTRRHQYFFVYFPFGKKNKWINFHRHSLPLIIKRVDRKLISSFIFKRFDRLIILRVSRGNSFQAFSQYLLDFSLFDKILFEITKTWDQFHRHILSLIMIPNWL